MSENRAQRASIDDLEHEGNVTDDESAPLLGNGNENVQNSGWFQASTEWMNNSKAYIEQKLGRRNTGRGKQRQSDANRQQEDLLDSNSHPSRIHRFRRQHPQAFFILSGLGALISIVLILIVIILIHLFKVTLKTPNDDIQKHIVARGFNIDGPDNVQVLHFSDDGIAMQIDARLGLDTGAALDEWLGQSHEMSWWSRKDRKIVEWALAKVKGFQVEFDTISLRTPDWKVDRKIDRVNLIPHDDEKNLATSTLLSKSSVPPPMDLVTFNIDPIVVPLRSDQPINGKDDDQSPPADIPIAIQLVIKPSGPNILSFAEYTLQNKTAFVDLQVESAHIRGMSSKDWLRGSIKGSSCWFCVPGWVNIQIEETWKRLAQKLPKEGKGDDGSPADFLNLTRYDFAEIGGPGSDYPERALGLDAFAEITNPLGKLLNGHIAYSLPFGAYLPVNSSKSISEMTANDLVLLAAVASEPLDIHGEDKIPVKLHGRVVQPPQTSSISRRNQAPFTTAGVADEALSDFLSKFLRGDPNTLIVRGGSPFSTPQIAEKPLPGGGSPDLPTWLDHLLRSVAVPISFPGSKVTDLIQNVTISNLTITPHPFGDDKFVCSGIIMGVMNMPGQLATVDVQITDLWPDVLIFNGKPPKHDEKEELSSKSKNGKKSPPKDGPSPLPDPLPDHAFGRVVPHNWSAAETFIDPEDPKGKRKLLRSELKNVPFTILPGRSGEFRSFSWKIVTGEGANTGIDGSSRAKIWNSGLGKLELSNLPVTGTFIVGKRGSDGDDGDDDGDQG